MTLGNVHFLRLAANSRRSEHAVIVNDARTHLYDALG